jgi:hypothetical protein
MHGPKDSENFVNDNCTVCPLVYLVTKVCFVIDNYRIAIGTEISNSFAVVNN